MCGTTPDSACEVTSPRTFGSPLTMKGTTPISIREFPCALKRHVHDGVSRKFLGSLSEHGCRCDFFDWVRYYRPYDSKFEEGELKMCPMIWCRKTFATKDLTIRHVFSCPRLSNAWYWCPIHKRPERFLECNKGCDIIRKPKMHQAAKFFNWLGRPRSLKRQAIKAQLEEETLKGSGPPSWKGSNSAMMPECVDEIATCPGRQSGIAELSNNKGYGDEICRSELAESHKSILQPHYGRYELSTPPCELPTSGSLRRQSSPELLHPINSESERHSLWQRRRGMQAGIRHRSDDKQCRSDWPIDKSTENVLSSKNPIWPDEPSAAYQFWSGGHAMSHTTSPNISASIADRAVSPVISPSSQNAALTSSPSDMLRLVSPINKYVYSPSNIVTPTLVTRNDSASGMVEQHEDAAGGRKLFGSLPLQSPLEEHNNTPSAFNSQEICLTIPRPVSDSMEVSASNPEQTRDSVSQRSFFSDPNQYEELDAPSISVGPHHSSIHASDSKKSTHSNHFDESSESEASSSMIQSNVTQLDNLRSRDSLCLQLEFTAGSPPQNTRIESSFQPKSDVISQSELTRSATAFHVLSSSRPHSPRVDGVLGPVIQNLDVGDNHTWEARLGGSWEPPSSRFDLTNRSDPNIKSAGNFETSEGFLVNHKEDEMMTLEPEERLHELGRSEKGQSFPCPDIQLLSPFDNLIAAITSELNSNDAQSHLNDIQREPAAEHDGREFATTEAFSEKLLPHCFDHSPRIDNKSAPMQIQVAELKGIISNVSREWLEGMKLMPKLKSRCEALPATSLFERAVRTLKNFTHGICALSFEDVFALMHLAFAAAFLLHWQHDFHSWSALFDDALKWQQVLPSNEDKIFYWNAMSRWRFPDLRPTPLSHSDCHTCYGSIMPQKSLFCDDQKMLSEFLRKSEVYKVCIGLLDGFEMADISKRLDQPALYARSQTWESQQMKMNITRPLLQIRGIEALRRVVIDTEHLIDRGLLYNAREVEVTLTTSGRWSSESLEISDEFHDSVTFQCDMAMLSSTWRNGHYVEDLDRLLEISDILDRQQCNGFAITPRTNTSGFAVMLRENPTLNSPTSLSPTSNGAGTLDFSPISVMSWTSVGSSRTAEVGSHTSSPTTVSQASTFTTSPDSSTQTISPVYCRPCSKEFKGSLPDAKSNYRRHLRESTRHNKNAGLKCPLPECHARRRMRPDNLKPHLQKVHKITSASEKQRIVDQCRLSANRGGSLANRGGNDGIQRRRLSSRKHIVSGYDRH